MMSLRETTVDLKDTNYHITLVWTLALTMFLRQYNDWNLNKVELYLGTCLTPWICDQCSLKGPHTWLNSLLPLY